MKRARKKPLEDFSTILFCLVLYDQNTADKKQSLVFSQSLSVGRLSVG